MAFMGLISGPYGRLTWLFPRLENPSHLLMLASAFKRLWDPRRACRLFQSFWAALEGLIIKEIGFTPQDHTPMQKG